MCASRVTGEKSPSAPARPCTPWARPAVPGSLSAQPRLRGEATAVWDECPRCFGGGPGGQGGSSVPGNLREDFPLLPPDWKLLGVKFLTGRQPRPLPRQVLSGALRNRLRDGGCQQERGAETSCKPACSAAGVFWLWQRLPARHLPRASSHNRNRRPRF